MIQNHNILIRQYKGLPYIASLRVANNLRTLTATVLKFNAGQHPTFKTIEAKWFQVNSFHRRQNRIVVSSPSDISEDQSLSSVCLLCWERLHVTSKQAELASELASCGSWAWPEIETYAERFCFVFLTLAVNASVSSSLGKLATVLWSCSLT